MLLLPLQSLLATVPEPAEYRNADYNAEVPETLTGAMRVSAVEVRKLMLDDGASVIDVLPQQRKPDDLPDSQWWFPVEHQGVRDAVWLPDVGYGELSEVTERYFLRHLEQISDGLMDAPLIFYCKANCWMSWNAAKRAIENGYTGVYWFADGIEDWISEGFETEVLTPAEGERQVIR